MENRLKAIYEAASMLFINKGYSRTQMKDIAKEIELSTGMIYVYFTGKKEILNFILKCTIDPEFMESDLKLPIQASEFKKIEKEVFHALEENNHKFQEPLVNKQANYHFEEMLSDAFDTISKYGIGCLLIEKNVDDMKNLAKYYEKYRTQFFKNICTYLEIYISNGSIRKVEFPEYTAQLIIETLSWWAMHVMNDAFEVQKNIPIEVAKKVCLDNLIHAYAIKERSGYNE